MSLTLPESAAGRPSGKFESRRLTGRRSLTPGWHDFGAACRLQRALSLTQSYWYFIMIESAAFIFNFNAAGTQSERASVAAARERPGPRAAAAVAPGPGDPLAA